MRTWSILKYTIIAIGALAGIVTLFQFDVTLGVILILACIPIAVLAQWIESSYIKIANDELVELEDNDSQDVNTVYGSSGKGTPLSNKQRIHVPFNALDVLNSHIKLAVDDWMKISQVSENVGHYCTIQRRLSCELENDNTVEFSSTDGEIWVVVGEDSDNQVLLDLECIYLRYELDLTIESKIHLPRKIGLLSIRGEFANFGSEIEGKWSINDQGVRLNLGDSETDSGKWNVESVDSRNLPAIRDLVSVICSSITRRTETNMY